MNTISTLKFMKASVVNSFTLKHFRQHLLLMFAIILSSWSSIAQTSQTYSSSSTWVAPAGVTSITVECWGGGGKGGSTLFNGAETGGGGGGAYARSNTFAVVPGTSYTVTVGTGSTGTGAGGDSWFGSASSVLAKGGSTVSNNNTSGASGGSAASSIGDVKFAGGNGANGSSNNYGGGGGSSAGTAAAGANGSTSNGGTAPSGGGNGGNGRTGSNGNGLPGSVPGGGGGGVRTGTLGSQTGGAGANGRVIVTWTCPTYGISSVAIGSEICSGASAIVNLSGSASELPVGTYTVTYDLSGANNATNVTSPVTVSTAGSATFSTGALANGGNTLITITNLSSGTSPICSNAITVNNTATISVINVNAGSILGAQTICPGGDPAVISNDVLGSGDGTITYFWESSTTSASAGFTTIPGETGDSYDPPGISVNTWFRRVTVSTIGLSSCQLPSNAVLVGVLTLGPPSVTAGASTTTPCIGSLINLTANSNSNFSSTANPNTAIPDNNSTGITSLINASGLPTSLSGWKVRVTVNITHTWTSDVEIYLARPGGGFGAGANPNQVGTIAGQSVRLSNDNGGSGDGYSNCVFRDDAASNVTTQTGNVTITGNFIPEELLSTLSGNPNGNWTLRVTDDAGDDTGTLTSWTLEILYPNGLTYAWTSTPSGYTSSDQNPTGVTVNEATTYQVVLTDIVTGCTSTSSVAVSVIENPSPKVIPGDTVLCNGTDFYIQVIDTGAYSGGYPVGTLLDWVNIITNQNYYDSLNVIGNGSSFQAKITLPSGCVGFSPVRTILSKAVVSNEVIKHASCNLNNGKIISTMVLGTAPFRYVWKNGLTIIRDTVSYSAIDSIYDLATGNYSLDITDNYGNVIPTEPSCTGGPFSYFINNVPPPAVSLIITNISCFGMADGSITASPNQGSAPYTYLWSNNATTEINSYLSAGTYTVTVTDNDGCTAEAQGSISEPGVLNINLTYAEPLCTGDSNGIVASSIGGGTPPFVFEWFDNSFQVIGTNDDSLFNVPAGTYHLAVTDANFCNTSSSIVVDDPPLLTASCNTNDATCFGGSDGSASINASGGRGIYSYLWSTGATTTSVSSLPAGSYLVTVTDGNGCTAQCTAVIGEPAQVGGNVSGSDVACIDGQTSVIVTGTGGTAPYTGEGSFTVGVGTHNFPIVDLNGCTGTATITINHLDVDAPVISNCPIDITQCESIVTWVAPSASDNCTLTSFVSNFNSGDAFPVGTTQVTYTATDNAGLVSVCTFNITIVPTPVWYQDLDTDGFGNALVSITSCNQPVGYIADNTDCDDAQLLYADLDNDTYGAGVPVACGVASNNDCNDGNAAINPGAAEVCNGIDDNCNGLTDDGLVFVTYYADVDGDGFGNAAVSVSTCDGAPVGYVVDNTDCDDAQLLYADLDNDTYGAGAPVACGVASNTDCNDAVAAINPGAAEVCNLIDDDCDGNTDEGVQLTFYADADLDTYGDPLATVLACTAPVGYVADNTDCDDTNPAVNPAAIEVCNLIDDDCDGLTDEGVQSPFYADTDSDSYGDPLASVMACTAPLGYVADNTDCNDAVAAINPGAAEVCNAIDDNCNGLTDDGLVFVTYYADVDGDGFGNASVFVSTCDGAPVGYVVDNTDCDDAQLLYADLDNDTYGAGAPVACGVASNTDCNDAVAAINPGAAEVCNLIDDDCDGNTDEGVQLTFYADADLDTYGDPLATVLACTAPVGYVADNTDCDDTNPAVNPAAIEVCNLIDDDCDGLTDEGVQSPFYADTDSDSYGDPLASVMACTAPLGYVADNTDCNDGNAAINPGAAEVCNGIDDNCNGLTDDGLVFVTYYADVDGDGFGNAAVSVSTCDGAPVGYVVDNTDCDDAQLLYADLDNDTYGAGVPVACGVASNNDCNDGNAAINPGAAEVCNGIDDNCNGLTDDGLVFVTYYADVDGDGFGNAAVSVSTCDGAPVGYVVDNTDCDDAQLLYADLDNDTYGAGVPVACGVASNNDCNDGNAAINPGAAEVCNGIDDNCNGLTDDGLVFVTYYADVDGDGFGNAAVSVSTCDGAPVGYVVDNTDCDDAQLLYADLDNDTYGAGVPVACGVASNNDCNDNDLTINPAAIEICGNFVDEDCDGFLNNGCTPYTFYADNDNDTYGDPLNSTVIFINSAPIGYVADNTDCDDNNAAVNPAATEICNLIDDDCDGLTDEGVLLPFYADTDSDTYGDPLASVMACTAPVGYVTNNTDCNDGNAAINPGAAEVCNGIDDNCNGLTDDGLVFVTYYADVDGDGFGNAAVSVSTCDGAPVGYVVDNTDCDDAQLLYADLDNDTYGAGVPVACGVASNNDCNDGNAAINPGAAEVCNGIDDNCNGLTDDGLVFVTYYADVDGDGFGNAAVSVSTCDGAPVGYVVDNTDCDDAQLLYADLDNDTYGAGVPVACGVASNNDCNDGNAAINPGAAEVCNGIDDNCNGLTDDGLVFVTYYADVDGDGFGNAAVSVSTCDGAPVGYVVDNTDCDDAQLLYADLDNDTYGAGVPVACGVASNNDCNDGNAAINPGAAEVCNGIDDNCNGLTDDGLVFVTYYADVDGDGFGNAAVSVSTCDGAPVGYVVDNTDCDDALLLYADLDNDTYGAGVPVACGVASNNDCNDGNAAINPGAAEVCNGIDDNCNGLTDDGLVFVTYYADVDGDGFGNAAVSVSTCDGAPVGYVVDNTDCDDAQLLYADLDNDTYGAGVPVACGVASNNDCNDGNAAINPGAAEVCNGIDDNCNGLTDDGLVFVTYYADVDGDGFGNAAASVSTCDGAPVGYVVDNTDCDDALLLYADLDNDTYGAGVPVACGVASNNDCNDGNAAINPGAAEVCNGIDDNCNGLTDDGLVFVTYYADVDGDGFGNAAVSVSTCDGAPVGYVIDNTDCDDAQLLYADLDNDTYGAGVPVACGVASNNDCNDGNAAINPGAAEVCNGIDDNCNGLTDDGLVFVTYYADVDGDGFGNAAVSVSTCDGAPVGYVVDNTDCDDAQLLYADLDNDTYGAGVPVACGVASNNDCNDGNAAINPGAAEVCNGIDDNCNGLTDDGLVFVTYYADVDGDGFGNAAASVSTCDGAPVGYVIDNTDCDDAQLLYADLDNDTYGAGVPVACGVASNNDCNDGNAAINPGAAEVCNGIDDNCNGLTDDGLVFVTYYADVDGDGFGNAAVSVSTCDGAPVGYVVDNTDCDDAQLLYADLDNDTYGAGVPVACGVASNNDCNDGNAAINPGAAEVCNGIDDNCNGLTDDGLVFVTYYADVDGDGFGNAAVSVSTCDGAPVGYVVDNTDCDDAQLLYADLDNDTYGAGVPVACGVASNNDCNDGNAAINPGAAEVCNGIDDNCNGLTDDGLVFVTYYADVDGDGFGNAAASVSTCDGAPVGYVIDNTDCDDAQLLYADLDNDTYGAGVPVACGVASNNDCNDGNAAINPGAAEICNGIDDNCNGLTDDGLVFVTYYADVDGDGFGNAAASVSTCDGAPVGYVVDNTDCDDAQLLYADLDNDTYGAGVPVACGVASNNDCNDGNAAINPGAAEVCNGIDDNCNGLTDDGLVFVTYYADVDGDGFGNAAVAVSTCDGAPVGYVVDNTDCDDAQLLYADLDNDTYGAGVPVACGVASNNDCNDGNAAINPGAAEVCNGIDDNCNGLTDDGLVFVTYYADVDGDGFGNAAVSVSTCDGAPVGYVIDNTDCDDAQLLYADLDNDTYGAGVPVACGVASNNDCNDGNAAINPGAAEVCNGIDDNCNGLTDDGLVFVTYYADVDGDGFGNAAVSVSTCDGAPVGYVVDNTDCDDAQLLYADLDNDTYGAGVPVACGVASNNDCNDGNAAINPGAAEVCNGIDDNCNGLTDDGLVFVTYYADVDGDGFGNAAASVSTCDGAPVGYVIDNTDCDDAQLLYADLDNDTYGAGVPVACGVASNNDCNDGNAAINPGAAEVCNGIDDNCNGLTDDGLVFVTYYADVDGDGFGNAAVSVSTCDGAPVGYVVDNTDCDDAQLLYADLDNDTYGAGVPVACGVASNNDCNDGNAAINPGAAEVCNGIDDNCNGLTDDGLVFVTYYADVDGDGFGNAAVSVSTCDGAPVGYVVDNTDCDDAQLLYADLDNDTYGAGVPVACGVASNNDCNDGNAAINPGAAEVCNGIDDNCNGLTDDGLVFVTYYADVDGDGFGNAAASVSTCDGAPVGYVIDNTDCDDAQLLYADLDNDTYGAGVPVACGVASNNDCNDGNAAINPGAAEICNGIDDNCNGLTDDGLVFVTYYADVDGDGFGNAAASVSTCDGAPVGYVVDNTDCDDAQLLYADLDNDTYGAGVPVACGVASNNDCNDGNAAINPGAAEVCNGIDDNCNGLTDDGLVFVTYYADVDGDGFGNAAVAVSTCDGAPVGYVVDNTDCDDAQLLYADLDNDTYGAGVPVACGVASNNDCNDGNAAINPGAAEICNGIDDNCNGLTDDGLVFVTYYADVDGDGFGNAAASVSTCDGAPVGYVVDNTDCDDAQLLYADLDNDTYGAGVPVACGVASNNDCNDGNAAINPGAAEVCNGIDDNCNGLTDDGLVFVTYYADVDGDGFGNAASSVSTCDGAPVGYVIDNTDCDDAQLLYADLDNDTYGAGVPVACGVASNNDCNDGNAAINPGAAEVCNGIDDNCNGLTDDGLVFVTYYADVDGDGFGNAAVSVSTCDGAPVGYVVDNTDCDDAQLLYADLDNDTYGAGVPVACGVASNNDCNDGNAAINPGAAEICNGIDDNCNGLTDDGLVFVTYYADVDGDGFGNAAVSVSTCDGAPVGYVVDNTDCDDAQLLYADLDNDTYGAGVPVACGVASNNDCNDGNAAINPGAAEVCNGIDDNCNGLTDDGLVFVTYYADVDGDGFGNAAVSVSTCDGAPVGYVVDNTDCDDAQLLYADLDNDTYGAGVPVACGVASNNDCNDGNAAINPGAAEVCNGIDDNCNGLTDDGLVFVTYYADVDGDGFGNAAVSVSTCDGAPVGYVVDNTDCDDNNAAINPAAIEICNGIDDNCNGLTDDNVIIPLGSISGPAQQCVPVIFNIATFSIAPAPGASNYTWTLPAGMTIVNGQGTNSIFVSWTGQAIHNGITGPMTVTATTPCGGIATASVQVDMNYAAPVGPPSISGPSKVCPGDNVTYSIASVARATSYNWTVPTGMTITSGLGSNVINVSVNGAYNGGTISVSASNICGTGAMRTKNIGNNTPLTPAVITGLSSGLCGASNAMLTTAGSINATSYNWNVPVGVSILSGQGTNTITFSVANGFTGGVVTVNGINGCGSGSARSINILGAPGQPAPITGPVNICPGQAGVMYEIPTVAGASIYTWTVPGGATIVSGQGTKTIVVNFGPNPATGQVISVRASNACGQSGLRSLSGISLNFAFCGGPRINSTPEILSSLNVAPNPARDNVQIRFNANETANYSITLIDLSGRLVFSEEGEANPGINSKGINTSHLNSGIYMVIVRAGNEMQQVRLVIE